MVMGLVHTKYTESIVHGHHFDNDTAFDNFSENGSKHQDFQVIS